MHDWTLVALAPTCTRGDGHWPLVCPAAAMRTNRGEQRVLLLIFFECLVCLFIWWRRVVIALGDQPQHRSWDMVQRQRRADWARNELQQRPVWWLMLSGFECLVCLLIRWHGG